MTDLRVVRLASPDRLSAVIAGLCGSGPVPARDRVLAALDAWAQTLRTRADLGEAGSFLAMWLRRANLEHFDRSAETATATHGRRTIRLPLGLVGHWTAGNVPSQAVLSGVSAVLGGNRSVVRVSERTASATDALLGAVESSESAETLRSVLAFVAFPRDASDCHVAMAEAVDGAMIWGGREAIATVRALPFPAWARLATFGPRTSAAAIDRVRTGDEHARAAIAKRLARDVCLFDQAACSSPQTVFVEADAATHEAFLGELAAALGAQTRGGPPAIDPGVAGDVARARARWSLDEGAPGRAAIYPMGTEWTILAGRGDRLPDPVGHRTIHVLAVDRLDDAIAKLDGAVQTLGLDSACPQRAERLAALAARRGVDRIVPIGQMHAFDSPWDGWRLVRAMQRDAVYVPGRRGRVSASVDATGAEATATPS